MNEMYTWPILPPTMSVQHFLGIKIHLRVKIIDNGLIASDYKTTVFMVWNMPHSLHYVQHPTYNNQVNLYWPVTLLSIVNKSINGYGPSF